MAMWWALFALAVAKPATFMHIRHRVHHHHHQPDFYKVQAELARVRTGSLWEERTSGSPPRKQKFKRKPT